MQSIQRKKLPQSDPVLRGDRLRFRSLEEEGLPMECSKCVGELSGLLAISGVHSPEKPTGFRLVLGPLSGMAGGSELSQI